MRAPSAAALARVINIESDFKVEKGVLYKLDLAAAANPLAGKEAARGGQTRFDDFTGHLLVDAEGYHFGNLRISSGVLRAQGDLSITPEQRLDGRIEVAVEGTASPVGTPLAVAGTVQSPSIRLTKGMLAGAAAGTALLGPGIGTTIGVKAAQITEKLFRKNVASSPGPARPDPAKGRSLD